MSVVQDIGRIATTMSRLAYAVQNGEKWSAEMEKMMQESNDALRRIAPLANRDLLQLRFEAGRRVAQREIRQALGLER